MNAPKTTDRLKVALLSLPPRTQAVLEFFFSSAGRSSFQTVDEMSAEAAIFDQDTLESREHWLRFHADRKRPGIALAVHEQHIDGAVWVHKPVTPAALMAAMALLRRGEASAFSGASAAMTPVAAPQAAAPVTGSPATPVAPVSAASVTPAPATPAASPVAPAAPTEAAAKGGVTARGGASEVPVSVGSLVERAAQAAAPAVVEPADAAPETVSAPSMDSLLRPLREGAPAVSAPRVTPPPSAPAVERKGLGGLLRRWLGGRDAPARPEAAPVAPPPLPSPAVVRPEVAPAAPSVPPSGAVASAPVSSAPAPSAPVLSGSAPGAEGASAPAEPEVSAPVVVPRSVVGPVTPMVPAVVLTGTQDAGGDRPIPVAELVDEPLLCGSRDDLSESDLSSRGEVRYGLDSTALSALMEAYLVGQKWQVPTQIEFPQGPLIVDTTQNLAYIDFDQSLWTGLMSQALPRRPKTRAISRQEFAEMSARWADRVTVARLDALLWRAGLETSVGRLPSGVSLNKPVFLKHWPNLTRLHNTPHAMRIAALWATRGAGLLETVSTLKVAQRHVFAFYNAALALDLITDDGTHVRRAQRRGARNKGLLRRLFGWLQK